MAYATIADFRAQGISDTVISDADLQELIDEACADIERYTGWWFESRARVMEMDGRGVPTLELPQVPIVIDEVTIEVDTTPLDQDGLVFYGGPLEPSESVFPRVIRYGSALLGRRSLLSDVKWPRGYKNIIITGTWGYTEIDGTAQGKTPAAIKRATMLMVIRNMPLLGDPDLVAATANAWRVKTFRTRDQQVSYGPAFSAAAVGSKGGPFTGDPTIDEILLRFKRPPGMGAA